MIFQEECANEMEMPCKCDCGKWFDLNDGYASEKKSNVLICESCHEEESEIVELENELGEQKMRLEDAQYIIEEATTAIKEIEEKLKKHYQ